MKPHRDRTDERPLEDDPHDARSLPPLPASDPHDAERPRIVPRRRGWRLPPSPR